MTGKGELWHTKEHKIVGENTKCPTQDVIDFAIKTVLQISHNHLLFSHNIVWFSYILMIWNINSGKNLENNSFLKISQFLA